MSDNKKFLLIVTHGRSGSTLLNGILNSLPHYKILGENHDAYKHICAFYQKMKNALQNNTACENNFNIHSSRNPWWNDYTIEQLKEAIREMTSYIIDPHFENKVIGWKEIRYPAHKEHLSDYLNLLHEIYIPKFLFLTRNLNDVVQSEWYAEKPEHHKRQLREFMEQMMTHIKACSEQDWYCLTYDDIINERLSGLFNWLNVEYDKDKIGSVLDVPFGYKTKGEIRTRKNNYGKK